MKRPVQLNPSVFHPLSVALRRSVYILIYAGSISSAQVGYQNLSPMQQDKFKTSCPNSTCNPGPVQHWQALDDSQQLEFAGGTQALGTVRFEDQTSGLQQISAIDAIVGSLPASVPSEEQFHIKVHWSADAPNLFRRSDGWSAHPNWKHPTQFGYQQNEDDTFSLGLIVLFDKNAREKGQFHMDFRFAGHFGTDNGNVAKNYGTYERWYLKILGYTPKAVVERSQPSLNTHSYMQSTSREAPHNDLRTSVKAFLTTWYVNRDFKTLDRFVAEDNVVTFAEPEVVRDGPPVKWIDIFRDAFSTTTNRGRLEELSDAITYYDPVLPPEVAPFKYLNAGQGDPFAIVDLTSVPKHVFFSSTFLGHLEDKYGSVKDKESWRDLALVIYVIKPKKGLIPETAITYWIREDEKWKIAAYRGWD
jgi:hypothetical protein